MKKNTLSQISVALAFLSLISYPRFSSAEQPELTSDGIDFEVVATNASCQGMIPFIIRVASSMKSVVQKIGCDHEKLVGKFERALDSNPTDFSYPMGNKCYPEFKVAENLVSAALLFAGQIYGNDHNLEADLETTLSTEGTPCFYVNVH
ncbi:MAG: hypothetical protein AABZ55_04750 [Bdellovibrionota bacterium]